MVLLIECSLHVLCEQHNAVHGLEARSSEICNVAEVKYSDHLCGDGFKIVFVDEQKSSSIYKGRGLAAGTMVLKGQ